MSTTVRIPPRSGTYDGSSVYSPTNPSNALTNTDSTTYASYKSRVSGTTTDAYAIFLMNFNFSLVPEGATIESVQLKVKMSRQSASSSSGRIVVAYDKSTNSIINSPTNLQTFGPVALSANAPATVRTSPATTTAQTVWDTIKSYGAQFSLAINVGRTSASDVMFFIYGAEIVVTYSLSAVNKVVYGDTTLIDLTSDTVSSNSMLSGITAHHRTGNVITGTIQTKTNSDVTFSNTTVTVPSGYYASQVSKTATDADLVAENIKKDINIFGVTGTYEGGGVESVTQDQNGRLHLDDDGGNQIIVDSLSVTQNGTYTASTGHAYSPVSVNISGGGGGEDDKTVKFIDYDGTILHEYTPAEFAQLSDLPRNPVHSGLTAQGWTWTKEEITTQLTNVGGYVIIGQTYTTTSGKTEIDVEFTDSDFLSPYLCICPNGTAEVDWGDNSALETITGTSVGTQKFLQHTYSQIGSYTIKISISGTNARLGFWGGSGINQAKPILCYDAESSSSNRNRNRVYAQCVKTIRIGSSVTLGNFGFRNCISLESVTIPNDVVVSASSSYGYLAACRSLKSVTLPRHLTSIHPISYCNELKSVSIPYGIKLTNANTTIFQNCYSLELVTIPYGSTYLGSYFFNQCYNLQSVTLPNTITTIDISCFNGSSLKSITIPNSVTTIGSSAFERCRNLESLSIPDSVTTINNRFVYYCERLATLTLPSTITSLTSNSTFDGDRALQSIDFPSGTTEIGNYALRDCKSLQTVTIPNTVTTIGQYAFQNCDLLKKISLPNTVTTIGRHAFEGTNSLYDVNIPYGVSTIDTYTFANCWSLTSLTIPSTVTTVNTYAFQYCYGMQEYHFQSTTPPTLVNSNAFTGIMSGTKIYVPQGTLNDYQTARNWSTYASYMVEES